jgi:hypothetical protein
LSAPVAKKHRIAVMQAVDHWIVAARPITHSQKIIAVPIEPTYDPESSAGIEFAYATD